MKTTSLMFVGLATVFTACSSADKPIDTWDIENDTGISPSGSPTKQDPPDDPPGPPSTNTTSPGTTTPGTTTQGAVQPPFFGTSGGDGGSDTPGASLSVSGVSYRLIAPSGSDAGSSRSFLLVISGVEGADLMLANLQQLGPYFGLGDTIVAVLDGRYASASDMALVLDEVRNQYDIDNDQTWLMSESAGTSSGLELAFHLRQSYFAAFWANDVITNDSPALPASTVGVVPWGNAGPGGDFADAQAIVDAMDSAGWNLPSNAPYSGYGAGTHGSTDQFIEAVSFFPGKVRQPY